MRTLPNEEKTLSTETEKAIAPESSQISKKSLHFSSNFAFENVENSD